MRILFKNVKYKKKTNELISETSGLGKLDKCELSVLDQYKLIIQKLTHLTLIMTN